MPLVDEEVRRLKAEMNVPVTAWGWTGAQKTNFISCQLNFKEY